MRSDMRSEVKTAVAVKPSSFCDVTQCSLVIVTNVLERRKAFAFKAEEFPTEIHGDI
jgi:hypothetical protein